MDLEDDDDEADVDWWTAGWFIAPPPPPPLHTRNMYIHECPFCHAIHERVDQFSQWCDEHIELKALWERRKRPSKEDQALGLEPWVCQGCEKCEAA